ncbi:L-lactate dehydrogenase [Candidatus Peregrinibacteria bacterium]|jgi:L-lactate dehydrogenase|nr:L-lactate dehydrogenase [Candidatus Peregrinibacteria bacterium]
MAKTKKSDNKSCKECRFKASVIGCGSVGATTAYAYFLSGTVTDLAIVDIDKGRAEGLMLDLEHATAFTPHTEVEASDDFAICKNSDLVVVTAGARQKEGETRLDLIEKNRSIFKSIIPKIAKVAPNAILLIVSNPVDILTHEALKLSKFPKNRVFGSGTVLDSVRLQYHISEKINVHPSSIDAYILGEHGDSSFPYYSSANILGKPLAKWEGFNKKAARQAYKDTKEAAYRIINDQGYTCYSIATVVRELTESIFEDKKKVFTLSVPLENYHGNSGVCLSVPCVLGKNGIEEVIKVPLNAEEKKALKKSVKTLKEIL